jgi:hypothetical protein
VQVSDPSAAAPTAAHGDEDIPEEELFPEEPPEPEDER